MFRNPVNKNTKNSLKTIITFLNIFGLLSVEGILSDSIKPLRFSIKSRKAFFSILLIIATFIQLTIFLVNGLHKLLSHKIGN